MEIQDSKTEESDLNPSKSHLQPRCHSPARMLTAFRGNFSATWAVLNLDEEGPTGNPLAPWEGLTTYSKLPPSH